MKKEKTSKPLDEMEKLFTKKSRKFLHDVVNKIYQKIPIFDVKLFFFVLIPA